MFQGGHFLPATLYMKQNDMNQIQIEFDKAMTQLIASYTGGQVSWYSKFSGKHICYFDHLSIKVQKQMIPHLKALTQGYQNQEKNLGWYHPDGGHAPLTEKVLL